MYVCLSLEVKLEPHAFMLSTCFITKLYPQSRSHTCLLFDDFMHVYNVLINNPPPHFLPYFPLLLPPNFVLLLFVFDMGPYYVALDNTCLCPPGTWIKGLCHIPGLCAL